MIKNFNNIFIRILQLTPYVQRLEVDRVKLESDLQKALTGELTIASMHMENGMLNVAFRTKVQEVFAEWAFSMLDQFPDASNYVEIIFMHRDKDEFAGTIRVQKHTGKSPHELRLDAEAERDEAIAAMNKAIAEKEQLELINLGIEYEDTDVPRGKRNV